MENLLHRLENVAARLERFEGETPGKMNPPAPAPAAAAAPAAPAAGSSNGAVTGPSVSEYDALLTDQLARFVACGQAIGGEVQSVTGIVEQGFKSERQAVLAMANCKAPPMEGLSGLVGPVGQAITAANDKTGGKRTDDFNHFKAMAEAIQGLTWVVYQPNVGMPAPPAHVAECWQTAEFYTNKVLMQYKGKDDKHVAWVAAAKELFLGLRDYCKKHHTTGPQWNAKGVDLAHFMGGGAAPAAAAAKPPPAPPRGGPPPPPPPMPPGGPGSLIRDEGPSPHGLGHKSASTGGMQALFSEINRGDAITSGLRKVTDDMKAKNRADKTGVVAASAGKPSKEEAAKAAAAARGPPKLACEGGRKWVVENQLDNKTLEINDCNFKQTVYVYNCKNVVLQINSKVNSICIDKCTRTAVVFTDVVAACEIVNGSSIEVQVKGVVPTVAVDNCSGVQIYISRASLAASITTAKSSEVNVMMPGKTDDDDLVEHAIPEQFVTTLVNGKWHTEPVAHSAG